MESTLLQWSLNKASVCHGFLYNPTGPSDYPSFEVLVPESLQGMALEPETSNPGQM